ncbi:TadE family type IV pilus minor pilin [Cryobacterium roopkundense]|uniref:Flp pilus assembly protein TadG n=1 Tax=Cryobacterium roopkundense TaxID=1001240 RepID=A0A7W8ZY56_9MICO|nr:TadE family type IV pilus minor pilin [Cryobacterium roopkundense]MBB5642297.1 Flp pilus assembly protein TadG [Cryobacterium roopkundense]
MTAELATVLPAVVLVLGCCLGAVQVIGQQVRLTDAAADAARALARGDSTERVAALVAAQVPGAHVSAHPNGEFLCATVQAASGFGPFSAWGLRLEASSCALAGGL